MREKEGRAKAQRGGLVMGILRPPGERGSLTHKTLRWYGVVFCRLKMLSEPFALRPSRDLISRYPLL